MVVHAAQQQSPQRLVLFYSNRRPEDAAFWMSCSLYRTKSSLYFCGYHDRTREIPPCLARRNGVPECGLASKYLAEIDKPMYYVVGPPMVTALRTILKDAFVEDTDIRNRKVRGVLTQAAASRTTLLVP